MTALILLSELRRQGVQFIADGGRLRVRTPRGVTLPDPVKAEIVRCKAEIVRRLHSGGIIAEDVAAVFPGAKDMTEAVTWLRAKLRTPQHIALVIAEWPGTPARPTGRSLDTLMEARWALEVEAYAGTDNRLWWRLPQVTVQ